MSASKSASSGPKGRSGCKITIAQLRKELEAGRTPVQIADKYRMTPGGVRKRIAEVKTLDAAAALAPENNRRFAGGTISAIEELLRCLGWMRPLGEACERYLTDPDNPEQFDVGPRAGEIDVIYYRTHRGERLSRKPERKDLQSLLDIALDPDETERVGVESKHADPRQLIVSVSAEIRGILGVCESLTRLLADVKRNERLKELVLDAIAKADPEIARKMAEELDRGFSTHEMFRGAGDLLS